MSPAFEGDKSKPQHPLTLEGTLIHKALETNDPSGLNDFQLQLYQIAQDWVEKIVPKEATRFSEIKFPILGEDYGYGDLVALSGSTGFYLDYKMGANKQTPVEENLAAQAYALGMMTTFPYLNQVKVFYLYPRLDFVDACVYYRGDIDRIVANIQFVKVRHNTATPETCTFHTDTCPYCKHLATCPTAHKALAPAVKSYADGHGLPALPDLSQITDPEKWARLLEVKPVLAQMADSIGRHALAFSENNEIPGFVREYVDGKREVTNVRTFVEALVEKGVDSTEILENCITISLTKALDLLKAKIPKGQKGRAVTAFLDAMGEAFVVERKSGYWKLSKEKPKQVKEKDDEHGTDRLEQTVGNDAGAGAADVQP